MKKGIYRILAAFSAGVICLGVICGIRPAAGALLGNNAAPGFLYDVNPLTGTATNLRPTNINGLDGVAFGPGGTLFGLSQRDSSPVTNALFRIDPVTGASTLIGQTGMNIIEGDLRFDPSLGVFFAVTDIPGATSTRRLFTINPNTGAGTVVGAIAGAFDPSAVAIDSAGRLLVLDQQTFAADRLLQLDKTTAAVISSVNLNVNLGGTAGMDFDPVSGVLYVVDGVGTNSLYTLDPSTGTLTLVGPTNVLDGLAGLAFVLVPEPSTLALAALGAVALLIVRRRVSPA